MKKWGFILLILLLSVSGAALAENITVRLDGTGDYTSLTLAVQNARAGDTILLSAGTYTAESESFPIALDKQLTIQGQDGAVLDSPMFTTLLNITSDHVTVENVVFQIRKWGVVAAQCEDMKIRNCTFALAQPECRTSSTAIWMEGMKRCTLENCRFEGVGVCVAGDPLNENSKGKPVLTGLCEVGEDPDYFLTHTIENCTVNGKPLYYYQGGTNVVVPEDAGGLIAAYCDGITVKDADVSDSSMGLEIVHSKNVVLDNVTANRCGIFGTYVACAQGGTFNRVRVQGTNHGIDTRASENITLTNCLAEDCDQGIFFSLCKNCVTENCVVRRSGFAYFAAVGENNAIRNSVFEDNADGIYLQNEQTTTIDNCLITGSSVVGLRILKSSCVCQNTAVVNGWTGAILYEASNTQVQRCQFYQNAAANLYMANVRSSEIGECILSGQTKAHVEVEGTFEQTTVKDCLLTGNSEEDIRVKGENQPLFDKNHWINEKDAQ